MRKSLLGAALLLTCASAGATGFRPASRTAAARQRAWAHMTTEGKGVLDAYGLLSQLASLSYHDYAFDNHSPGRSGFPRPYLAVGTRGGRFYEFDPEMTEVRVFHGDEFPRTTVLAREALGETPEVQMRALLAAPLMSRVIARLADGPDEDADDVPSPVDGARVLLAYADGTGAFDASRQTLLWRGREEPARSFSELVTRFAQAHGVTLPLGISRLGR